MGVYCVETELRHYRKADLLCIVHVYHSYMYLKKEREKELKRYSIQIKDRVSVYRPAIVRLSFPGQGVRKLRFDILCAAVT